MSLPEPLLRRVPRTELPAPMQTAWDRATEVTGDATFIEVSGNNPELFGWYLDDFYGKVYEGGPRSIARFSNWCRLRLANLHGCAFCNKGDRAQAVDAGLTRTSSTRFPAYEQGPFSEAEKAALALADEMALTKPVGR